jgi:hypothetical protein
VYPGSLCKGKYFKQVYTNIKSRQYWIPVHTKEKTYGWSLTFKYIEKLYTASINEFLILLKNDCYIDGVISSNSYGLSGNLSLTKYSSQIFSNELI